VTGRAHRTCSAQGKVNITLHACSLIRLPHGFFTHTFTFPTRACATLAAHATIPAAFRKNDGVGTSVGA
jgi:hypothetical protein